MCLRPFKHPGLNVGKFISFISFLFFYFKPPVDCYGWVGGGNVWIIKGCFNFLLLLLLCIFFSFYYDGLNCLGNSFVYCSKSLNDSLVEKIWRFLFFIAFTYKLKNINLNLFLNVVVICEYEIKIKKACIFGLVERLKVKC